MKLKTYQAWSMPEAIAFVKRDLGDDAVILHTRTFERGGFLGFRRRTVVEITAGRAAEMPSEAKSPPAPLERSTGVRAPAVRAAALGAYAASGAGGAAGGAAAATAGTARDPRIKPDSRPAVQPGSEPGAARGAPLDMDAERERTRRLAQAMAIRFDRIEEESRLRAASSERTAATTNERAVEEATHASERRAIRGQDARTHQPAATAAQRFVLVPEAVSGARGPGVQSSEVRLDAPPARPQAATAEAIATRVDWPGTARAGEDRVGPVAPSTSRSRPLASQGTASASGELDAISNFVGRVLERRDATTSADGGEVSAPRADRATPVAPAATRSPLETAVFARLIGEEVAQDLARRLAAEIATELEPAGDQLVEAGSGALAPAAVAALRARIAALLPADGASPFAIVPGRHGPRRIAFIGPTGVGKTTTLAKVAAQLKLHRGLSVGIVAADTYRIAAVDQLRTYAEILGLPIEVAASPREASEACARLGEVDVILIDTAGRSQNDCMKLSELRAFLAAAAPDETHLVLSATAGARTLAREAEAFGQLGVDRLALTKLDEAAAFGTLVSLVAAFGKPLSFLTHGQEVPDHIEEARGSRLATLLLASGDGVRDLRSPMSR